MTKTLLVCTAFALCEAVFPQEANVLTMAQPDCTSESPNGMLRFYGYGSTEADSVTATLFRSGYTYVEFVTADSFDVTIPAPSGFYQSSSTSWIDGGIDTVVYSDIAEMNSCQPMWVTLQILGDTNCEDSLAPVGIKVYTDQGAYLNATIYQSGLPFDTLEGVGFIDTVINVPPETYDLYVYEYFNGIIDSDNSDQVVIEACVSTGVAETEFSNTADFEIIDMFGRTIASGQVSDIAMPITTDIPSNGTYVIRYSRDAKPVMTRRISSVR